MECDLEYHSEVGIRGIERWVGSITHLASDCSMQLRLPDSE